MTRFRARRQLAFYALFPEGYTFLNRLSNSTTVAAMVLTPPNLIAEQDFEGRWTRRERVEAQDGPPPYTQQWYSMYLRNRCLPPWFMSVEHQSLIHNDHEAGLLGVPGASSSRPQLPPPEYLALRYPTVPLYLRPSTDRSSVLSYDLPSTTNDRELRALARRFPAVLANRMLGQNQISVSRTGHIILRRVPADEISSLDIRSPSNWRQESKSYLRASYRQHWVEQAPSLILPVSREAEEEILRAAGAFPDLDQIPHGLGHFSWLHEIDERVADALGYRTPDEIVEARQTGGLAGMRDRDRPRVVWYPDRDFFQPQEQPTGQGYWEFFTVQGDSNARVQAALDWGNGPVFPDTSNPTAEDIWHLRQRYRDLVTRGMISQDPTNGIELVWIPGTPETDDDGAAPANNVHSLYEEQDQQQS